MKDLASQTQLMGACFWIVAQDYYVLNKSQHGISGGDLVADQRSSILFTTLVTHLPCRLNTSYQRLTLLKTLFLPDFTFWLYSQCWQYREHSVEIIVYWELRHSHLHSSAANSRLRHGRAGLDSGAAQSSVPGHTRISDLWLRTENYKIHKPPLMRAGLSSLVPSPGVGRETGLR